ncbi:MAG: arginase family protein [Gemmataceae bacterium]|nr:arginase family protein [Gemmataceae bacterium]
MEARILDLDGSLGTQPVLAARCQARTHWARDWGPRVRMACSFRRFRRFEQALAERFETAKDDNPCLTWYGSGDFHHVTLALLRRLTTPFNLLILDNHPDWMRHVPLMHCGTWVWHAARLPLVRRIFHVGGHVDFDNGYRWLAPWSALRSGKITVIPATHRFRRAPWGETCREPIRTQPGEPAAPEQIEQLLWPMRGELAEWPLYVSLDKDVMIESDSVVNWDSGQLTLPEVSAALETCWRLAEGRLAGMDIVGDWSPVRLQGLFRRLLHWTEHPSVTVDRVDAARRNQWTNLELLDCPALRVSLADGPSARSRAETA